MQEDRKSTRLNSSHSQISYAVFCLKKKFSNSSGESSVFASGSGRPSSASSSTLSASVLAYSSLISAAEGGKAAPGCTGEGIQRWVCASAATFRAASDGGSLVFPKTSSLYS